MSALTLTPRPTAGTKVGIPVRQEHIDRGKPGECFGCALALAVADVFPDATGITVAPDRDDDGRPHARVWASPASWIRLMFGDDAKAFVTTFDACRPVEPAVFTAEVA